MKTITIRDLHLETSRRVRDAAAGEVLVITDRGRPVATLQPWEPVRQWRPLPDRETRIRRRSRLAVDSAEIQAEMRERA
jgi:prevent-host-death family protein